MAGGRKLTKEIPQMFTFTLNLGLKTDISIRKIPTVNPSKFGITCTSGVHYHPELSSVLSVRLRYELFREKSTAMNSKKQRMREKEFTSKT